ncbi:(2Fe-2S)-binding protein [Pseudomonas sp. Snoq117.2]|uniref:(2Fe-2S)-binding protein n=1 Tax=Pseudomonas TaxID=286 RepID=UPI0008D50E69|nr:(2Fe-2S)-binding protein [Pseudomonas sp. Snoq117.2]SEO58959.1 nicotinate dehydrogenase subunit A [Pseudomonas sp. Snoq117.2]
MAVIELKVNGEPRQLDVDPGMPLLEALRDELGLKGPKFGCGLGECGACTVLADGKPVRACLLPAASFVGREVLTLEGLGTPEAPHALQQAFIEEQAAQCGYCIPGMVMTAQALLARVADPSDAQIRQALAANFCGCGTHYRILRAIKRAAVLLRDGKASA